MDNLEEQHKPATDAALLSFILVSVSRGAPASRSASHDRVGRVPAGRPGSGGGPILQIGHSSGRRDGTSSRHAALARPRRAGDGERQAPGDQRDPLWPAQEGAGRAVAMQSVLPDQLDHARGDLRIAREGQGLVEQLGRLAQKSASRAALYRCGIDAVATYLFIPSTPRSRDPPVRCSAIARCRSWLALTPVTPRQYVAGVAPAAGPLPPLTGSRAVTRRCHPAAANSTSRSLRADLAPPGGGRPPLLARRLRRRAGAGHGRRSARRVTARRAPP